MERTDLVLIGQFESADRGRLLDHLEVTSLHAALRTLRPTIGAEIDSSCDKGTTSRDSGLRSDAREDPRGASVDALAGPAAGCVAGGEPTPSDNGRSRIVEVSLVPGDGVDPLSVFGREHLIRAALDADGHRPLARLEAHLADRIGALPRPPGALAFATSRRAEIQASRLAQRLERGVQALRQSCAPLEASWRQLATLLEPPTAARRVFLVNHSIAEGRIGDLAVAAAAVAAQCSRPLILAPYAAHHPALVRALGAIAERSRGIALLGLGGPPGPLPRGVLRDMTLERRRSLVVLQGEVDLRPDAGAPPLWGNPLAEYACLFEPSDSRAESGWGSIFGPVRFEPPAGFREAIHCWPVNPLVGCGGDRLGFWGNWTLAGPGPGSDIRPLRLARRLESDLEQHLGSSLHQIANATESSESLRLRVAEWAQERAAAIEGPTSLRCHGAGPWELRVELDAGPTGRLKSLTLEQRNGTSRNRVTRGESGIH